MLTYEHFCEYMAMTQDKTLKKHPELAMSQRAAIDGMLEKAKRDGAREVLEEIAQAFRNHGVTYMLRKMDELEEEYGVDTE